MIGSDWAGGWHRVGVRGEYMIVCWLGLNRLAEVVSERAGGMGSGVAMLPSLAQWHHLIEVLGRVSCDRVAGECGTYFSFCSFWLVCCGSSGTIQRASRATWYFPESDLLQG